MHGFLEANLPLSGYRVKTDASDQQAKQEQGGRTQTDRALTEFCSVSERCLNEQQIWRDGDGDVP